MNFSVPLLPHRVGGQRPSQVVACMREKEENHFTPSFFLGQELGCVDRSRIEKERKGADRKVARKGSFFSSALYSPLLPSPSPPSHFAQTFPILSLMKVLRFPLPPSSPSPPYFSLTPPSTCRGIIDCPPPPVSPPRSSLDRRREKVRTIEGERGEHSSPRSPLLLPPFIHFDLQGRKIRGGEERRRGEQGRT